MAKSKSIPSSVGNQRYVALLRAINVGGRTVKSLQLVKAFESLGFSQISTFIASGNVIFDSPATDLSVMKRNIESQLRNNLGYEVETFLRTLEGTKRIAKLDPFKLAPVEHERFNTNVVFFNSPVSTTMRKQVAMLRSDYDDFYCQGREIYWLCRGKISDSPLFHGTALGKAAHGNQYHAEPSHDRAFGREIPGQVPKELKLDYFEF